ncbi:MAG: hypothetical protein CMH54_01810 [Myxococcales bacterium]|nr:hypothetical protein [Myxococcales bacterium]
MTRSLLAARWLLLLCSTSLWLVPATGLSASPLDHPGDLPTLVDSPQSLRIHPGGLGRTRSETTVFDFGFAPLDDQYQLQRFGWTAQAKLPRGMGFGLDISGFKTDGDTFDWAGAIGFGQTQGPNEFGLALRKDFGVEDSTTLDMSMLRHLGRSGRLYLGLQDIVATAHDNPVILAGLGIRPGVEWLEAHVLGTFEDGSELASVSGALRLALFRGALVDVGVTIDNPTQTTRELTGLVRLSLPFGSAGHYEMYYGQPLDTGDSFAGIRTVFGSYPGPVVSGPAPTALLVDVGTITSEAPTPGFFGQVKPSFSENVAAIINALDEPETRALVLQVGEGPLQWSQAVELAALFETCRARKIETIVVARTIGAPGLLLSTQADHVLMDEAGGVMIAGLYKPLRFLAPALDKLGIRFQFVRHAEYKSFPEMLTRDKPSGPFLEAQNRILDVLYSGLLDAVAKKLGADQKKAEALLDKGPLLASEAKKAGLVDTLYSHASLRELVAKKTNLPKLKLRKLKRAYRADRSRWGSTEQLALVTISGDIVRGRAQNFPGIEQSDSGEKDVVKALEMAARAPYRGVLIRVVSPGGDVLASETIARAVTKVAKRKPVVVSMGSVAASGGYLVSLDPDIPIVATPYTLTGSVGIFAMKPVLRKMTDSIGLPVTPLTRGKHAGLFSVDRPWTDDEQEALKTKLAFHYKAFVDRVANARKQDYAKVEPLCRGRVWTGNDALDHKLIDSVDGLPHALALLRKKAGIDANTPIALKRLQGQKGVFGNVSTSLETKGPHTNPVLEPLLELFQLDGLSRFAFVEPGVPLARLPMFQSYLKAIQ